MWLKAPVGLEPPISGLHSGALRVPFGGVLREPELLDKTDQVILLQSVAIENS
jgi:hypothetical protein